MNINELNQKPDQASELILPEFTNLPVPFVSNRAKQLRGELIAACQLTPAIHTAADQETAISRAVDIRTLVKSIEVCRVELTKPLLNRQREIKALADEYTAPLIAEQRRVEALVTGFQEQEARRVAFEEQQRQKALQEAERVRLEAEAKLAKASEKVNTDKQLDKAIAAEEKLNQAEAQIQNIIAAPIVEAAKATGASVRKVLRWEVTNIDELAKARPDLCRIEPKASAIQSTCVPERPVPGLKLWWENDTSIRARR